MLFNISAFGCDTFKFEKEGYYTEYFSYWYYEDRDDDECANIDEDLDEYYNLDVDWDAPWKTGRAATIIGSIFSYLLVILLLVSSCFRYPKVVFKVMGGFMLLMSILSLLLLVGLASDSADDIFTAEFSLDPKISTGAILAIVAAVFWAGAGISMFFCMQERTIQQHTTAVPVRTYPQPAPAYYPDKKAPQPVMRQSAPPIVRPAMRPAAQDCTITEEEEMMERPDGTRVKVTTKTTTFPDGSKEVVKSEEEM